MYYYTLIVGEHINTVQFSQTCIFHKILSNQMALLRICQLQSSKSDSFTFYSAYFITIYQNSNDQ